MNSSTLRLVDNINREISVAYAVMAAMDGVGAANTKAVGGIQWILDNHIDSLQAIAAELHESLKAVQS